MRKTNSVRYRKNVERDEEFIDVTCGLVNRVEWAVRQNMTVDIYEDYFTEQVKPELSWLSLIFCPLRTGPPLGLSAQ